MIPATVPFGMPVQTLSLSEAITAFEGVDVALKDANVKQVAADEKFAATQAAKVTADLGRSSAAAAFNTAIDNLIAAAQASRIPV